MLLGKLITNRREILSLSLRDVAERMAHTGYDPTTPHPWPLESQYWNRLSPLDHKEFCHSLASALGMDVEELMRLTEDLVSDASILEAPSQNSGRTGNQP